MSLRTNVGAALAVAAVLVAAATTSGGAAPIVDLPALIEAVDIGSLPPTPVDQVVGLEPKLVIDPPAWDFGDADVNHGASHYHFREFVVRNEGAFETGDLCFRLIRIEGSNRAFDFPGGGTGFCTGVRLAPGHTISQGVMFANGFWDEPTGEQRGRLEVFERTEHSGSKDLGAADLSGRAMRYGYWLATDGGTVVAKNGAPHFGDTRGIALSAPITALGPTPTGSGYWLAAADGAVYPFGNAEDHGSAQEFALSAPVIGMAVHPRGVGYWLVSEDGGVFAFGEAAFLGGLGDEELAAPVVSIAATPSGDGYWLVAADGAVFPFGDAEFHGSADEVDLDAPILSMAPTGSADGYWLVSADGAVFPFGEAQFHGSPHQGQTNDAIYGISRTQSGAGYWLAAASGRVFHYGDATQTSALESSELGWRDGEPNVVMDIDAAPVPPRPTTD